MKSGAETLPWTSDRSESRPGNMACSWSAPAKNNADLDFEIEIDLGLGSIPFDLPSGELGPETSGMPKAQSISKQQASALDRVDSRPSRSSLTGDPARENEAGSADPRTKLNATGKELRSEQLDLKSWQKAALSDQRRGPRQHEAAAACQTPETDGAHLTTSPMPEENCLLAAEPRIEDMSGAPQSEGQIPGGSQVETCKSVYVQVHRSETR